MADVEQPLLTSTPAGARTPLLASPRPPPPPPPPPPTHTGTPRIVIEDDAGRVLGDTASTAAAAAAASAAGAASALQTTVNVIQVFTGTGLLAMPYALRLGGWAAMAALGAALAAFRVSAGLLDAGLAALPPGTPKTFAALGAAALGPAFRPVVGTLAVVEFGGGATLTLAILYKQAALLVAAAAAAPPTHLAAAVLALLLPSLALPSFRRLTPLSAVGCASTVAVAVAVAACVVVDPTRANYGGHGGGHGGGGGGGGAVAGAVAAASLPAHGALARPGIIRSLGIFAMACSGHSSIPALRSSMADPASFPAVLTTAFAAMGLVYAATAAAGYWYFGDAAEPVVTANLAAGAPFVGKALLPTPPFPRGVTAGALVGWAVAANALTTLPSMFMIVDATLWSLTPWARGVATSSGGGDGRDGWLCRPGVGGDAAAAALRRPRRWFRFASRAVIATAASAAGVLAATSLGNAVALVGGVAALACSLILPTVCYGRVVGVDAAARPGTAVGLAALLIGGVGLMVLIIVQSVDEMARGDGGGGG